MSEDVKFIICWKNKLTDLGGQGTKQFPKMKVDSTIKQLRKEFPNWEFWLMPAKSEEKDE